MKLLNDIMLRFLRAASVKPVLVAEVLAFEPNNLVRCWIIISNLRSANQSGGFLGKTQGQQAWRMATELRKMGKNKFVQTLSPQWKRLPFAGT
ncbi:MAG: hypothetical protein IJ057_13585 [Bacteroidales bacterium]|nr:hypothetical protein [Bacteroidales bacterium]MBQ8959509.1 hypothetical protein [Bacteroidales bacterium]